MHTRHGSSFYVKRSVLRVAAMAVAEALETRALLSAAPAMNPGPPPNGPYALSVAPTSSTNVVISFTDNADNETEFVIERAPAPSGGSGAPVFTSIKAISPSDGVGLRVSTVDTTTVANTSYVYRVRANNGQIESSFAGPVEVTTPADGQPVVIGDPGLPNPGGAPNSPFNLQLTAISPGQINLSFVDNASNETGFIIERAPNPSVAGGPLVFSPVEAIPPLPGALQTYSVGDAGLAPTTTYFYRVRATNGPFSSGYTNVAGASVPTDNSGIGGGGTGTPNPGGPPNAPFGATLIRHASSTEVTFIDNATKETGFAVQRATTPDGLWVNVGIHAPSAGSGQVLSVVDSTTPVAGETFYYRVFALNGPFQSSIDGPLVLHGPPASVTGTVPNAPYNLRALALGNGKVRLDFTNNADNQTVFSITRSLDSGLVQHTVQTLNKVAAVGETVSFFDSGLTAGSLYFYGVAAANDFANSSTTSPISVLVT